MPPRRRTRRPRAAPRRPGATTSSPRCAASGGRGSGPWSPSLRVCPRRAIRHLGRKRAGCAVPPGPLSPGSGRPPPGRPLLGRPRSGRCPFRGRVPGAGRQGRGHCLHRRFVCAGAGRHDTWEGSAPAAPSRPGPEPRTEADTAPRATASRPPAVGPLPFFAGGCRVWDGEDGAHRLHRRFVSARAEPRDTFAGGCRVRDCGGGRSRNPVSEASFRTCSLPAEVSGRWRRAGRRR